MHPFKFLTSFSWSNHSLKHISLTSRDGYTNLVPNSSKFERLAHGLIKTSITLLMPESPWSVGERERPHKDKMIQVEQYY